MEEGDTVNIVLVREGGITSERDIQVIINPVPLDLVADLGEAIPLEDYTANFGLFFFPSLVTNISLQLTALNDTAVEGTEALQIEAVHDAFSDVAVVFIEDKVIRE